MRRGTSALDWRARRLICGTGGDWQGAGRFLPRGAPRRPADRRAWSGSGRRSRGSRETADCLCIRGRGRESRDRRRRPEAISSLGSGVRRDEIGSLARLYIISSITGHSRPGTARSWPRRTDSRISAWAGPLIRCPGLESRNLESSARASGKTVEAAGLEPGARRRLETDGVARKRFEAGSGSHPCHSWRHNGPSRVASVAVDFPLSPAPFGTVASRLRAPPRWTGALLRVEQRRGLFG